MSGVVLAIFSTLLLTIGLYLPRLSLSHADPIQISFLRYVGGTGWLLVWYALCWLSGKPRPLNITNTTGKFWHILRALIGIGTLTMTVIASRLLPLGNVQAILACNGLLVLGWIAVRRAEPLHKAVLVGTVLCVLGAILSSQADIGQRSIIGYIAAIAGCVFWAAEIIVFRHAVVCSAGTTSLLFINLVGVVFLFIPAMFCWHDLDFGDSTVLMSVGLLLVGSQAALVKALERVSLSVTIPFRYLNVPTAVILGLLFLHQIPSVTSLVGIFLIMIGGSWISRYLVNR